MLNDLPAFRFAGSALLLLLLLPLPLLQQLLHTPYGP
jgi:hypothetical protein